MILRLCKIDALNQKNGPHSKLPTKNHSSSFRDGLITALELRDLLALLGSEASVGAVFFFLLKSLVISFSNEIGGLLVMLLTP